MIWQSRDEKTNGTLYCIVYTLSNSKYNILSFEQKNESMVCPKSLDEYLGVTIEGAPGGDASGADYRASIAEAAKNEIGQGGLYTWSNQDATPSA